MKLLPDSSLPIALRLLAKVVVDEHSLCWEWTGALSSKSKPNHRYGNLIVGNRKIGRRHVPAHRQSYETFKGPAPEGLDVCHRCDNPLCINPSHLFLGTRKDNMHDMSVKGRGRKMRDLEAVRQALTCEMSSTQIAEKLGMTRPNAVRTLARLEELGHAKIANPGLPRERMPAYGRTWVPFGHVQHGEG